MDAQKSMLRGIVTANPTAMNIQQLAGEYRNTIGEPIPYQKFGYNSLEHFLRSIPDTVQIQGSGPLALVNPVVSNKSSHVMALVSRQKIETKRGNKYRGYRMPLMRRHVVVTTDFLKNSVPNPPQPQKMCYPPANKKTTPSLQSTPISNTKHSSSNFQVTENSHSLPDKSSSENKNPTNFVESKNTVIEKPTVSYKFNNVDHEVKQITKGIENTTLSTAAMKLRNSHSFSKMDHDSVPSKSNNIFNKQTDITKESNNNILVEDSEEYVPVSVKNNLKNLIRQYPDGIWCAEIPCVYRKMFKRELKYQDLGFRNLIDLCMCLKSIFHYVRPSKEDFRLFDRSKPLPASAEKYFAAASFSSKCTSLQDSVTGALPSLNWSDVISFLPPNVFKPGNEIPRTFVPEDTKENDTIDVVVGEIFDVSKFWVYRDDGKLDKLMDDIQVFYKDNANEYKLPQDLIREGVYCVAIIIGEYHRALIIDSSSLNDDSIRVFFIDYGTMAKVKSELYFLHEQFAELPAQTIRCRLANICPLVKGAPWTQESSKEFRRLIKKRDLTAKISRVDWKDQYLEVFLADVTESHNVFYINNVLVEKGFAIFPDQEQKNSLIDALSTPIVNLIHLFPTFVELEHGLAPSTLEMEIYHKCNTPINFCYPQYFKVDLSEEENLVKHYTEFWETNILKGSRKMLHHHHNIDCGKINDKPLNFSLFGELEEEMREYLGEGLSETYQEPINHDETRERCNETANELREDCRLTEGIMNDLLNICELNSETDSKTIEHRDKEKVFDDDEFEEYGGAFSKHPLQDLSFSRSNSTDYSDSDKYSNLLNGSVKSDVCSNDGKEELLMDDQVVNEERTVFNPNNPFLQDLDHDEPEECLTFAPSNPFLSYIPKEDDNERKSDSTTSSDYRTCIQEVKKAWSTVDHSGSDMSTSLVSNSTDTSIKTDKNSESASVYDQFPGTAHTDAKNSAQFPHASNNNSVVSNSLQVELSLRSDDMRPGLDISRPEFYPQNYLCPPSQFYNYPSLYPPPFPNPVFPNPAFANPYYNMAHQQVYMRSSYNVMQMPVPPPVLRKPIGPPPGFGPNPHGINSQQSRGQSADFYDAYNQILKKKYNS